MIGDEAVHRELRSTNELVKRQRDELRSTNERLKRQRDELRRLQKAQAELRVAHRELHGHALALEGKLTSALLALETGDYDEARTSLVQARAELALAVSDPSQSEDHAEAGPGRTTVALRDERD